ncbi:MAG: sugar phosphate isomerase/epimerase [Ruminococcaceae bacterium]|nr:sugar phosphate isomerase/epimerase [Oscillospiraceae bacterium]
MKLAISNIAFEAQDDEYFYSLMNKLGFCGLEIAPTRIIPQSPYDNGEIISDFSRRIKAEYGLDIVSMQSIWFGINQRIFSTAEERNFLVDYTKKAIDFAHAANCKNLVFGCPRNRVIDSEEQYPTAVEFFHQLGDYAASQGTVVAIEANPPIYNTNFINNDTDALKLWKEVSSDGFKINLDMGTVIHNQEDINELDFSAISHVHLSEPGLVKPQKRELHKQLADMMKCADYKGYVSIEMKKGLDRIEIEEVMNYAKEVFS